MFRYIILEGVDVMKTNESTLITFFTDIMHIDHIETFEKRIIFYFHGDTDLNYSDIILTLSSDTLSDIRLYESYRFRTEIERKKNLNYILDLLKKINISKQAYLNEQLVLSLLIHQINKQFMPCFLKSYANDALILNSVRMYLESNQNTSLAAKHLFVHRNTLIQRIDKFIDVTGFNVREFVLGCLIYQIIIS